MTFDGLLDHLIITVVGWIVGTSLGYGVGVALIPLWRKIDSLSGKQRLVIMMIPWRTVIAGVLLINLYPIIPVILVGLGTRAGIISVALVAFFVTIIMVGETSKADSLQLPLIIRSASWIRSLGVLLLVVTTYYGTWGGGGLGFLMREYLNLIMYEEAIILLGWILGIALILDLISGLIQYIVHKNYFYSKT